MKKSFYLMITVVAVMTIMASCKGKEPGASNSSSAADAPSMSEAQTILSYTNAIIDVLKLTVDESEASLEYYKDEKGKFLGQNLIANRPFKMSRIGSTATNFYLAFAAPGDAMGNDKKFFADTMKLYHSLVKDFNLQDSIFAVYVTAEDFKDDKFAKGKGIIEKQTATYTEMVKLREIINLKIESVANAAEEVSLKNSPIKDAYKAAKADLARLRLLVDLIANNEKYSDEQLAKIDTAYADYSQSIEKNKAVDHEALVKQRKDGDYARLYNEFTEKVAEIKPVIRNIKASKKLTEDDYRTADRIYTSVVSSYNSWVK